MLDCFARLFSRRPQSIGEAKAADVPALSALHAASFRRGWSEDEFERLLLDPQVTADRALRGRQLCGFVLSRRAADEAEILSVAVSAATRGRGVGRDLLALHLRRLAGLGVRVVFLEVDEANVPALRLYARAGFEEVGRRPGYYGSGPGKASTALILRRALP